MENTYKMEKKEMSIIIHKVQSRGQYRMDIGTILGKTD